LHEILFKLKETIIPSCFYIPDHIVKSILVRLSSRFAEWIFHHSYILSWHTPTCIGDISRCYLSSVGALVLLLPRIKLICLSNLSILSKETIIPSCFYIPDHIVKSILVRLSSRFAFPQTYCRHEFSVRKIVDIKCSAHVFQKKTFIEYAQESDIRWLCMTCKLLQESIYMNRENHDPCTLATTCNICLKTKHQYCLCQISYSPTFKIINNHQIRNQFCYFEKRLTIPKRKS
jgi:hypothetical protein